MWRASFPNCKDGLSPMDIRGNPCDGVAHVMTGRDFNFKSISRPNTAVDVRHMSNMALQSENRSDAHAINKATAEKHIPSGPFLLIASLSRLISNDSAILVACFANLGILGRLWVASATVAGCYKWKIRSKIPPHTPNGHLATPGTEGPRFASKV